MKRADNPTGNDTATFRL